MFVAEDDEREFLNSPMMDKDYAFATDGNSCVIVDRKLLPGEEFANEHHQNTLRNILPEGKELSYVILIKDIVKLSDMIPMVYELDVETCIRECGECSGTGEVTWEYSRDEMESKCPVCDGGGDLDEITKVRTGKKIKDTGYIKVGKSYFSMIYFDKIIKVAETLGVKFITLICQPKEHSAALFQIADIRIMLMPCMVKENDKHIIGTL